MKIKSKIPNYAISQAVYDYMNEYEGSESIDNIDNINNYLLKKLIPEFVKLPEVQAEIIEKATYHMQEDEDMPFDLLIDAFQKEIEFEYSLLINREMVNWFKELKNYQSDVQYERTYGRSR